jgi:hypothetical protein
LAAALVLVSTAESLRKPGPKTRDSQPGVSPGAGPTRPVGDHGPA